MTFESSKTSFILENHDPYLTYFLTYALLGFLYRHLSLDTDEVHKVYNYIEVCLFFNITRKNKESVLILYNTTLKRAAVLNCLS